MKELNVKSELIGTRYMEGYTLPDFPRKNGKFDRDEALRIIQDEEYGYVDDSGVTFEVKDITDRIMDPYTGYTVCGKAEHTKLEFTFKKGELSHTFAVDLFKPKKIENPNLISFINFREEVPNKHCPIEELMDLGAMICHIYYQSVTSDDWDMENGLSKMLINSSFKSPAGKIAVWSYAIKAVTHHLVDNGYAKNKVYVAGHSRLGKTSLFTCATDTIFDGCFVNCSGCGGAAIYKEKRGERIDKITEVFGYWFTPSFKNYASKDETLPFDQHYLMAACCPREVLVVAATLDDWADLEAQRLNTEVSSIVYSEEGYTGLNKENSGKIKFFLREGIHFFSREDWNLYLRNI